jgi:PAS domain S-box-containing protein
MLQQKLQESLESGRDYNVVHRSVLKSGRIKYFQEVGEIVKDENGQVIMMAGMVQDVTEQKLVENQLNLSEQNYRVLFDQNPVPLWMIEFSS